MYAPDCRHPDRFRNCDGEIFALDSRRPWGRGAGTGGGEGDPDRGRPIEEGAGRGLDSHRPVGLDPTSGRARVPGRVFPHRSFPAPSPRLGSPGFAARRRRGGGGRAGSADRSGGVGGHGVRPGGHGGDGVGRGDGGGPAGGAVGGAAGGAAVGAMLDRALRVEIEPMAERIGATITDVQASHAVFMTQPKTGTQPCL